MKKITFIIIVFMLFMFLFVSVINAQSSSTAFGPEVYDNSSNFRNPQDTGVVGHQNLNISSKAYSDANIEHSKDMKKDIMNRTNIEHSKDMKKDIMNRTNIEHSKDMKKDIIVNGTGKLIAKGNGKVSISGNIKLDISGTGTLTIIDNGGDIVITKKAGDMNIKKSATARLNKQRYTGTGSMNIKGSAITVELEGKNIDLTAEGTARAILSGTGTYKTCGITEKCVDGSWTVKGTNIGISRMIGVSSLGVEVKEPGKIISPFAKNFSKANISIIAKDINDRYVTAINNYTKIRSDYLITKANYQKTVKGTGKLIAKGNGTGYISGNVTVDVSGTGTLTIIDNDGDMIITKKIGDMIKASSTETNTSQYTGTGSMNIKGSAITVELEGKNIDLTAEGTGTATINGTGIYKVCGKLKPGCLDGRWTTMGTSVTTSAGEEEVVVVVEKIKSFMMAELERIISHFELLKTRVENIRVLDEIEKDNLISEFNEYISYLENVKKEVTAATTMREITAIRKEMKDTWLEVRKGIKRARGLILNARIIHVLNHGEAISAHIENKIKILKTKGMNTSQLETRLAIYQNKLASGKQKYRTIKEKLETAIGVEEVDRSTQEGYSSAKEIYASTKEIYTILNHTINETNSKTD